MQFPLGMPSSHADEMVKAHRVEQAKREYAWQLELAARRLDIAAHACIDIERLRQKLGI